MSGLKRKATSTASAIPQLAKRSRRSVYMKDEIDHVCDVCANLCQLYANSHSMLSRAIPAYRFLESICNPRAVFYFVMCWWRVGRSAGDSSARAFECGFGVLCELQLSAELILHRRTTNLLFPSDSFVLLKAKEDIGECRCSKQHCL